MKSSYEVIGALTLMIACIMLMSGIWCHYLSPTTELTKHVDSYWYSLSIEAFETRSITFLAEEGEYVDITIMKTLTPLPPRSVNDLIPADEFRFNVKIFDPEGRTIWEELNVTYLHFRAKVERSGAYRVEVTNLMDKTLSIPIYVLRTIRVEARPLAPGGQWLSLISLPVFGFGIWMTIVGRRKAIG